MLALVAAVYAPTVDDYFGGDDFLVIGPVANLGPWELIWKSVVMQDNIVYWRPLVSPLYALEVHGFGLRPWAYHLVALGLHLLNVALLALVAAALTGRRGVALAAALLFGVHAAHTTTVAQISSTVELLSVVWYFAAVLCAVRWVSGPHPPAPSPDIGRGGEHGSPPLALGEGMGAGAVSRRWYWLAVAAFVLALLTKESTASAAGVVTVLFFLSVYLPGRRRWRFVLAALSFWALVIPYIAFTYLADTDDPSGAVRRMYFLGGHVGQNMWWFLARLAAPFQTGHGPEVTPAGHIGAALLLAAAAWALVRGPQQARFLVLWTGIALTPLAPWRPDLLLGRFTYQASAPFAVLLALGGAWAVEHMRNWLRDKGYSACRMPHSASLLTLAAAAVLAPLTVVQNRERTQEGETYRALVATLRRECPDLSPGSEVQLLDGVWPGPFHALYLSAVADTLYGAGNVRIANVAPGEPVAHAGGPRAVHLRYRGGELRK